MGARNVEERFANAAYDADEDLGSFESEVGSLSTAATGNALEQITRGEIDIQIATAKRFPRSMTEFKRTAYQLATIDQATAQSMWYSLPRGGKKIEGPSIRFAEVLAYSWGNLRVDAAIVEIGDTHITAMGSAFDLERNTGTRTRTLRRITDKDGKRYNEDMIGVTGNAAMSIAFREAVFKIIPRSLAKDVYDAARRASLGKGTFEEQRKGAVDWFTSRGITLDRVLAALDRPGLADLDVEDVLTLRGFATAINEGEASFDTIFPVVDRTKARRSHRTDGLEERLAGNGEKKGEPKKEERKPEPERTAEPATTGEAAQEEAEGDAGDSTSEATGEKEPTKKERLIREFDYALSEFAPDATEEQVAEWTAALFGKEPTKLTISELEAAQKFLSRGQGPGAKKAPSLLD
jgi:hypothetical protein